MARDTIKVPRLRMRERATGLRLWWEPEAAVRKLGFEAVEFDPRDLPAARSRARELNAAVDAARKGTAPAPSRRGLITVEEVVEDYFRSLWFTDLAAKTQKDYRAKAAPFVAKWGLDPVAALDKPVMSRWYEALVAQAGPYQALALVRFAGIICGHAERRGWRPANSNPCLRLGVSIPAPRSRVAEWHELDALLAAADRLGLRATGDAIALSFFTGQRETDVIGARRGDLQRQPVLWPGEAQPRDVWVWHLQRSKTGSAGSILLHDELAPRIAAILARPAPADAALLVDERVGRPFDVDLFQKRWQAVLAAAAAGDQATGALPCPSLLAAPRLQFRDLRRSFSVHARRNGASRDDAGSALGNSAATNARIAQVYMPPDFWTAARAVQAVLRPGKRA